MAQGQGPSPRSLYLSRMIWFLPTPDDLIFLPTPDLVFFSPCYNWNYLSWCCVTDFYTWGYSRLLGVVARGGVGWGRIKNPCVPSITAYIPWSHSPLTQTLSPFTQPRCYLCMTTLTLSLFPLLWRHWLLYYDVTNPSTMTSLTPLLWRHWPLYYDVTNPLLWRH